MSDTKTTDPTNEAIAAWRAEPDPVERMILRIYNATPDIGVCRDAAAMLRATKQKAADNG